MTGALAVACWCLISTAEPDTLTGAVQVTHGVAEPYVWIAAPEKPKPTRVVGDLTPELQALSGAKVEAAGVFEDEKLVVRSYRILDLGGGARPDAIGQLIETAAGYAIADGEGTPIPLNLSPKMKARVEKYVMGKVWVRGSRLLSGEIKVTLFGVLREPPARPRRASDEDNSSSDNGGKGKSNDSQPKPSDSTGTTESTRSAESTESPKPSKAPPSRGPSSPGPK